MGLEGSIAQYDPLCSRYRYPKSSTSLDNFSIATHGDMGIHQFKTHHIYIYIYISLYIYHYIYIYHSIYKSSYIHIQYYIYVCLCMCMHIYIYTLVNL